MLAAFWDFRAYSQAPWCNLNGTWYNELGSSMFIRQTENGLLEGQYNTAVELNNGTSGGGQCIPSSNNGIVLKAHWSLVAGQRFVNTSWNAFYTGMDNFYKDSKEE
ncbi:Hypothetical predicted protein [Octopus vulgaris]|uniref:Uncharacterized protein n=1 Tax=Octopus vulgaris TaxID=6645 RepID=A0AA36BDB6_OCTVU|nr:Hypothetical predicted protein [Octopus vulgaris]